MVCGGCLALWCQTLTVEDRRAAVVDHRHLLQMGPFTDVRQQSAASFTLLTVQLRGAGVGLGGHIINQQYVQ